MRDLYIFTTIRTSYKAGELSPAVKQKRCRHICIDKDSKYMSLLCDSSLYRGWLKERGIKLKRKLS